MSIFKSCFTTLLLDDTENCKSKYHDCKVGIQFKVYTTEHFSLLSQKRDRERKTMREPRKIPRLSITITS